MKSHRRRQASLAILPALLLAASVVAGEAASPAVPLDRGQAAFLRERARAGDPAMQCLYGLALLTGSAGFTDREEGADWLRQSAEGGSERGALEYGKMLYHGTHGKKDAAASLVWLIPAAEAGSAEAAYYAGAALLSGDGVDRNPAEAEKWMRRAAEAGLPYAQADMGVAYYAGLGGIPQDYREALRWFTLSAKAGNGDSCNKLVVMYRHGQGVTADPERAILWFAMGANLGNPFAQFNLAHSYMNGTWLARDYQKAVHWYREAASRGNLDSHYYLGCLYADGLGVEKDVESARDWLIRADRAGHADAGRVLEKLYELEDDPQALAPPRRLKAADLLQEFALSPPAGGAGDGTILLEVGWTVQITASPDGGTVFLTMPGYPGVIACEMHPDIAGGSVSAGSILVGRHGGATGLPGFLRLVDARLMTDPDGEDGGEAESGEGDA